MPHKATTAPQAAEGLRAAGRGFDDGQEHPRFAANMRVSTDRQGRSGLGFDALRSLVERHAALLVAKLAGSCASSPSSPT